LLRRDVAARKNDFLIFMWAWKLDVSKRYSGAYDGTHAETVSAFLTRRSMPRGAVVLVDEAGQIGGEQMLQLLDYVQVGRGRIILSGDTRQHGAVEASDALRAIEQYSGLQAAELTNIRRQNPDSAKTQTERQWLTQYRLAVDEARHGKLGASFDRLEKQGAIMACSLADQQQKLTEHFLELFKHQQSTVVVSQSWNEIHRLNDTSRLGLKAQNLIGQTETAVTALERLDLTDAQKRDKRFYQTDSLLLFNRNTCGFRAGDTGKLQGLSDKHLLVESNNRIRPVPFKDLERITVCQPKELALSTGDRLQLKANDKSQDGRKLANGELVTVKEIHPDGRIALNDGRVLPKRYRQFVRGYAVTSYAAQGKNVDYVLFSDSAVKAATNQQQWYVTISHGRKGVKIFTADKIQLRENVARSGDRTLALDMAQSSVHKLATILGRNVAYVLNLQHSQRLAAEWREEALRQEESERQMLCRKDAGMVAATPRRSRNSQPFRATGASPPRRKPSFLQSKRQTKSERQQLAVEESRPAEQTESVKPKQTVERKIQKSQSLRERIEMARRQANQNQQSRGMRV
jgi:ATP-dependent exoDNAse (exonuclease V) alpha subunit